MIDPQPYVEEALHIVSLVMKHLDAHEVAKLLRPAPEGYKYEVQIVKVLPEANPVPASPFHTEPPPTPAPVAEKFEYRGISCEKHGQQAHRRRRHASGPWICEACSPETP